MSEISLADEVEAYLKSIATPGADAAADPGGEPQEGECLVCFVARMLTDHGCDTTLRWAVRFRDARSPSATGLERRLGSVGGFCDCEIFLNGYQLVRELLVRDLHTDELEAPAVRPPCSGVRRTSTRPCANWQRIPRGYVGYS